MSVEAIRAKGARYVTAESFANSGPYLANEQPRAVAALIERRAGAKNACLSNLWKKVSKLGRKWLGRQDSNLQLPG